MGAFFEKVSRFNDIDLPLPVRATENSAGYDLAAAEEINIPPLDYFNSKLRDEISNRMKINDYYGFLNPIPLDDMAKYTKELKAKIPLVSTGMKCHLEPNQYLELSVRSSTPLKHWLVCGNAIGIIDSDYYNNEDNEGEIFIQLINLSPFVIKIKQGDKIAQGIIKTYGITEDDNASGTRTGGFGSTSK